MQGTKRPFNEPNGRFAYGRDLIKLRGQPPPAHELQRGKHIYHHGNEDNHPIAGRAERNPVGEQEQKAGHKGGGVAHDCAHNQCGVQDRAGGGVVDKGGIADEQDADGQENHWVGQAHPTADGIGGDDKEHPIEKTEDIIGLQGAEQVVGGGRGGQRMGLSRHRKISLKSEY